MIDQREFTAASFNQFLREKVLMGSRCRKEGHLMVPPRQICPYCLSQDMEWIALKGTGRLAAFTCISVGPTFMMNQGFDRDKPYCTGIVELEEGPRISARILGVDPKRPESIKIGSRVEVRFLDQGEGEAKRTYLAFEVVKGKRRR